MLSPVESRRTPKPKSGPSSPIVFPATCIAAIALVFLYTYLNSTSDFSSSSLKALESVPSLISQRHDKYLYWGTRIDCPGKHCLSCEGLGHQESSLRCALEEAIFLQRTFVMPSRMCINPIHNKKGMFHHSDIASSDENWNANSCSMDSLYDIGFISETVPVILDNSKMWYKVLTTSMKLGDRGVSHVERVSRVELKNSSFSNLLLINRTASLLSWFAECKNRNNRSALILPYSFLPSRAAKKLRNAADKIKEILGDYDAIHVCRGDRLKTRRDMNGVEKTLSPHLDRDTHPEFILRRIEKWVPPGRTLYIASNERKPGFFSPLSIRYKLAYSSNYSRILEPLIENNYQLFMIERLILMGAKTFIRTFKEDDTDLYLTDDPKKNTKNWQIPVYTMDEKGR
ncbi:PREDICTED: uncharacterized protein LOC101299488 isoform X2 [Fragaria vesca subsp. vesca]|uniref:uncharacterized protein LOC101299488 isoform X2 n=1 Tax=Fragaria vesca subsp. vesca TaxID=101020 RepID=UPI0002C319C4|nr:PREDICTED: uncharacterized protein LOC101299488 isoform X2 [Fragaria vesca subsp. vesca]